MKKLRQIITAIKSLDTNSPKQLEELLWQYICYSPKMPVRLQQQQLLDQAETLNLKVTDEYFAQKELSFNTFKWVMANLKYC